MSWRRDWTFDENEFKYYATGVGVGGRRRTADVVLWQLTQGGDAATAYDDLGMCQGQCAVRIASLSFYSDGNLGEGTEPDYTDFSDSQFMNTWHKGNQVFDLTGDSNAMNAIGSGLTRYNAVLIRAKWNNVAQRFDLINITYDSNDAYASGSTVLSIADRNSGTPWYILNVFPNGDANFGGNIILNGERDEKTIQLYQFNDAAGYQNAIKAYRARGVYGTPTSVTNDMTGMSLMSHFYLGSAYKLGGQIRFKVVGSPNTEVPTKIEFSTATDTVASTVRLTIAPNGDHTISSTTDATSATAAALVVAGGIGVSADIWQTGGRHVIDSDTDGLVLGADQDGEIIHDGTTLKIHNTTAGAADTGAVTIAAGGDIGHNRGANIQMFGNEHANAGRIDIFSGIPSLGTGGIVNIYGYQTNMTGVVSHTSTIEATAADTASLVLAGGLGIEKDIWGPGRHVIDSDSNGLVLGDGQDVKIHYYGTEAIITTVAVAASDLIVDCGAEKTLELAEAVWDDLRVSPGSFDRPGISDPTIVAYDVNGGGVSTYLWQFDKDNLASFTVQLPHSYKLGTDISVHIHWTPGARGNEENGATVGWKVDYSWANIDGAFGTMATADLSDACDGTDHKHQMTPAVAITGTGKTISSMLLCNIKRTDTGTDDTWATNTSGNRPLLLEIDFHYQIYTMGSRAIGVK
jgi:hypothetical protein